MPEFYAAHSDEFLLMRREL